MHIKEPAAVTSLRRASQLIPATVGAFAPRVAVDTVSHLIPLGKECDFESFHGASSLTAWCENHSGDGWFALFWAEQRRGPAKKEAGKAYSSEPVEAGLSQIGRLLEGLF